MTPPPLLMGFDFINVGALASCGTLPRATFTLAGGAACDSGGLNLQGFGKLATLACPVGLRLLQTFTQVIRLRQYGQGDYNQFGCVKGAGTTTPKTVWAMNRSYYGEIQAVRGDDSSDYTTSVYATTSFGNGDHKTFFVEYGYNTNLVRVAENSGAYEGQPTGVMSFTYGSSPTLYLGHSPFAAGDPQCDIEALGFYQGVLGDADRATIATAAVPFPLAATPTVLRPWFLAQ